MYGVLIIGLSGKSLTSKFLPWGYLLRFCLKWLPRGLWNQEVVKIERCEIIQLSSSSLKFYMLCLTPIVIMVPEYLASKKTWVKGYPAVRMPYWIQCRLGLHTSYCFWITGFLVLCITNTFLEWIHWFWQDPYFWSILYPHGTKSNWGNIIIRLKLLYWQANFPE